MLVIDCVDPLNIFAQNVMLNKYMPNYFKNPKSGKRILFCRIVLVQFDFSCFKILLYHIICMKLKNQPIILNMPIHSQVKSIHIIDMMINSSCIDNLIPLAT